MAYLRSAGLQVIPAAAGASYETGDWTISMTFGSGGPGTNGGNYVLGQYTKLGNMVYVSAFWGLTSLNGGSGACYVSGFPYTIGNTNQGEHTAMTVGYAIGLNITASENITANTIKNSTYATLRVWNSTGGVNTMDAGEMTADGGGIISGSYFVD